MYLSRMISSSGLTAACVMVLVGCASTGAGATTDTAPSPQSPESSRELIKPRAGLYAEASRAGDMIWTAGHLPEGVLASATMQEQVNQALDNLEETLEAAGAGFDTVVKANVYITTFDDWEAFNAAFFERMNEFGLPPRSTVAVSEIGLGYRVEIEMVARVRSPSD